MKNILYLVLLSVSLTAAQSKYITKTGQLNFEASVPSFEEVAAKNSSTTAILNSETGEFAALALVKGFRFKNALMEEHFNENYAESNLYPKATFKGKISDFNSSDGNYKMTGDLTFHGVTKTLENLTVDISSSGEKIIISGGFVTDPSDYNIEIPKIVRNKIAESVTVNFVFELITK